MQKTSPLLISSFKKTLLPYRQTNHHCKFNLFFFAKSWVKLSIKNVQGKKKAIAVAVLKRIYRRKTAEMFFFE